mmetsp:Transcript_20391/g.43716  ORF Transcript_20391/g.43716 Transcript_20391/m.43716 type:complete len:267 (-) Transcript_20391:512-1312(-)
MTISKRCCGFFRISPLSLHLRMRHSLRQKGGRVHLDRTVQSIVIMTSLDQPPALDVEFLLDACRVRGPLSISRSTVIEFEFFVGRLVNQSRADEETLGLRAGAEQRGQCPRIQALHPPHRPLHQHRRVGQPALGIAPAAAAQEQRLTPSPRLRGPQVVGQPQQILRERGVQPVPCPGLLPVQHPVLGGVSPVAARVIAEVPQDVGPMRAGIPRDLVDRRAAQRHERHLRRPEVGLLGVPLGRHGQRERQGWQRERQAQGGTEGATV